MSKEDDAYKRGYYEGRNGGILDDALHSFTKSIPGGSLGDIRDKGYDEGRRDRERYGRIDAPSPQPKASPKKPDHPSDHAADFSPYSDSSASTSDGNSTVILLLFGLGALLLYLLSTSSPLSKPVQGSVVNESTTNKVSQVPPVHTEPMWEPPGTAEVALLKESDARLNRLYNALMRDLTPKQQVVLRNEERAWIKWRDAEVTRRLGPPRGGSGYRVDYATTMRTLIEERINTLSRYERDSEVTTEADLKHLRDMNRSNSTVPHNDGELTARIVGRWNSRRHSYIYRHDGTWQILGGTTQGRWHVRNAHLITDEAAHRILALSNESMVLHNPSGPYPFRYERAR